MLKFKQLSDWLPILHSECEECPDDLKPVFEFDDEIYHLADFVKIYDSEWIDDSEYPDYIHAIEEGEVHNPYFIEIDDAGENVRVYIQVGY